MFVFESTGSHRARLFVNERTAIAFRPLLALPRRGVGQLTGFRRLVASRCENDTPGTAQASRASAPPRFDKELRGVVVLFVDSLRSDRLQVSRERQNILSNTLALAERGSTFPNTYTTSPGTSKAFAAALSGVFSATPGQGPALTSPTRAAGIRTVVVSGHPNIAKSRDLFDVFDSEASIENFRNYKNALTSAQTIERTRHQLAEIGASERFFLLVHLFDPHAHYVGNTSFDFGWREIDRYDAEVAFTDAAVGPMLEELASAGDIGIVIMSDHGDEFFEHRYWRHQLRVYDESVRVPLIVFDPRVPPRASDKTDVSTLDIAPTVLEMLSIERPKAMEGHSLLGSMVTGAQAIARPIVIESTNQQKRAVVSRRRKLIVDSKTGIVEYYDLRADPEERSNMADEVPVGMIELACELDR